MKKLVSILLASSMLLCLCACNKKQDTNNDLPGNELNEGKISAGSATNQFESSAYLRKPSEVEGPGGYIQPDDVYEDVRYKVEKYEGSYRIWDKNDPVYAYIVEQYRISRNSEENGYCYVDFDLFKIFEKIFKDEDENIYNGLTSYEFLFRLTTTCMERYKAYNDPSYRSTEPTFPETGNAVNEKSIDIVETGIADGGLGAGDEGDQV